MRPDRGPRLVRWVIGRLAPPEWRESILGDLTEEARRRQAAGRPAGSWWALSAALVTSARLATERRHDRPPSRARAGSARGLGLDLRQTFRALSVNRGYTVTAVVTLALGLGATSAVFTLSDALLFRPVPGVGHPSGLVTVFFGGGGGTGLVSVPAVDALATSVPSLARVAGEGRVAANLGSGGMARRIDLSIVSGNYFDVLEQAVARGRGFTAEEGRQPGAAPVVVISDGLWRQAFAGVPSVVGMPITVNGDRWTIVGVGVPGFTGPSRAERTEAWVPVAQYARLYPGFRNVLTSPTARIFETLFGRLARGATADQVSAQAEVVRARLAAASPKDFQNTHWRFLVRAGLVDRDWVRSQLGGSMTLLFGFVALLLVLTCANVANLMLMRATGRRAELATHAALGASRARLIRLLLLESVALASLGGLAGLALCLLAARAMTGIVVLRGVAPLASLPVDWRVVGFAAAAAVLVAVTAGILPALTASRAEIQGALRETTRSHTGGRGRARRVMAAMQVAVSLTLLIGALLLTRSMALRRAIDPGFDPSRVFVFSVEPGLQRYDAVGLAAFYHALLDRTRRLPAVRAAGVAALQPLSRNAGDDGVRAEGQPPTASVSAEYNAVTGGFFDAMGVPLVTGRDFTDADMFPKATSDTPAIINVSLARKLFGPASAIGRRILLQSPPNAARLVVGVVADMRQRQLLEPPQDMLFEPLTPGFATWSTVVVGLRRPEDAASAAPAAQRVVSTIDATMPIYDAGTLEAEARRQFSTDNLLAQLTGVFASLATLLAAVGLYGVIARTVAERRREFGIRMALGARPALVARLLARDAVGIVLGGAALGLGTSAGLARLIESRLFEVSPWDPVVAGAALALLLGVACAATQPAVHRATHVDPAQALRD
jgi:putative ABC transport system permease protein